VANERRGIMSGGSYDYLCWKDADQLINSTDTIQEMADRLAGLGYAEHAAYETQQILLTIRQFRNRIEAMRDKLMPVWHAIEWWDSCDWGEDQVKEAIEEYMNEP